MENFVKWSFFLFASSLCCLASNSSQEAFKPDLYQNYLSCLALCGKRHTYNVTKTLMSGEIVTDWVEKDKFFDVCDSFCQDREKYPILADSQIETIPTTEFDRLKATCIERESISPLKIRVKLFIQHKELISGKPLFVVETWRSLATNGGVVKNSIAGRHFTFSDRFVVPYTFANNPNQENLYIRIFAFTPDGPIGKPLCSGSLSPGSLINFQQKPMTLALMSQSSNSSLFLQWSTQDKQSPPECDQVLQVIMDQNVQTKWINLDSSHVIPLPEINENFTYKVKLTGLRNYQSNSNTESSSIFIIEALHGPEAEDWTQSLVSYSGLIITICIAILLILVCVSCFFCCRKRRKSRLRAFPSASGNIAKFSTGQFEKKQTSGFNYSMRNEDTGTEGSIVHENASSVSANNVNNILKQTIPRGLNRIDNFNGNSKSFPFDEQQRNQKPMITPNIRFASNITSTPIINGIYQKHEPVLPPNVEDLV